MKFKLTALLILQLFIFQGSSHVFSHSKMARIADSMDVKLVLENITEKVLSLTTYNFIDRINGTVYSKLQDIPQTASVKLASDYNEWEYQNSLVCFGMDRVYSVLKTDDIKNYTARKINFMAENYPFFNSQKQLGIETPYPLYFKMSELWYCGLAANAIDAYSQTKDDRLRTFMDKFENHIFHVQARLPDNTLIRIDKGRKVVQSDDAYMAAIFLVRMWKLTNDQRYLDEAINQVYLYHKYLFDAKDNLYHHVWYCDENRPNKQYWGRGNGWMLLSIVELLDNMPNNHLRRKEILLFFKEQVKTLATHQQSSGLWCQVLNVNTSFQETSCSAMFTYSIAKGVNKGWLPKKYKATALKGWNGLLQKITPNNEIEGVCVGTHFSDDINFYLTRPTVTNDRHVMGSFLLAGVEILELDKRH